MPTAVPLDTHRIAILPLRVTGADSSLGEGIAELLAAEFTGESGPLAAHPGSVIRAFRQAGGNAGTPLTQPVAARVARQLGAGYYVDGSIVGLGNRLTVSASVVSVADGQVRRGEPIRASSDSLDVLVSRLTTTLLGLAGGESREGSRGTLTSSPTAMRAYLEGMAAWRRYRIDDAGAAFERALAEDSVFARAALMRYWIANWGFGNTSLWSQKAFALRQRLSTPDRLLLVALQGERYPVVRTPAESFGDRERAAAQLPESPEAQYLAGDWLFHYGGAIDAADAFERSRAYFARSFAIDSQQTVLGHLVDVAVYLGDTSLLRTLQPALEPRVADMEAPNWLAAGYLTDRAWLNRLRGSTGALGVSMFDAVPLMPAIWADSLVARLAEHGQREWPFNLAMMQGRPEAARRSLGPGSTPGADFWLMMAAMAGEVPADTGAAAAARFSTLTPRNPAMAATLNCILGIRRAWLGIGDDTPLPEHANEICSAMLGLLRAWRAQSPDLDTLLESADSLVRSNLSPVRYQGYEDVILARVWEARGNRRRALAALGLRPVGGFTAFAGYRLREMGRLAASLGDANRAQDAYRRYLDLRRDAEPSMQAERDSVRTVMQRLVRP